MSHSYKTASVVVNQFNDKEIIDKVIRKYQNMLINNNIKLQEYNSGYRFELYGDYYSVDKQLKSVIRTLEDEYNRLLAKKIEELRKRQEEERIRKELERLKKEQEEMERKRLELIENNKKKIKEKAKKMGYKVKETVKNGKVKMVLVRRTY